LLSALLFAPLPRGIRAWQEGSRKLGLADSAPQSERRLALVIGNGVYQNAPSLKNPPNDATDMAKALSGVGFTVEYGVNLTQKQMKAMIREFGQKLRGGGQGLFYFAGHGIQLRGRNYLIPVEADIQSEADVEDQGVDASLVLGLMDEANNGLNVVIMDACRNNPFARSFRSTANGLAQVDAPTGTLIAYATAPGKVARDGTGRNGAYTAELLKQMKVPGLGIEELLKRVRASLKQQTNGEQVPWESSSLVGDFYLNRPTNGASAANKPASGTANAPVVNPAAVELEYWETIKNSTDAEDFREYLKEYPSGAHAVIARSNLRRLEAAGKTESAGASKAEGTGGASNNAGSAKPSAKPGAVVRNQMGMELAYIPAGSFMMGSSEAEVQAAYQDVRRYFDSMQLKSFDIEQPQHRVEISQPFYIGRYEVTQAQWKQVMGSNPSEVKDVSKDQPFPVRVTRTPRKGCDNCPVDNISWNDAQEFIRNLNARNDGYTYRLPTEAEWEYACRAETTTAFSSGDSLLPSQANFNGNYPFGGAPKGVYLAKTIPVGSYQPNGFGLYDMHGNVWEWCEDIWHEDYNGAPPDGSAWLNGGDSNKRVLRGGSWNDIASSCRSAYRLSYFQKYGGITIGLRVVALARK
jgi:Uncharacterized conserved protein